MATKQIQRYPELVTSIWDDLLRFLITFLNFLWAGHVARMGEKRNVHVYILVEKPEGKRPLGGVDSIDIAQDRDLRTR
jgi:hypothetical protein